MPGLIFTVAADQWAEHGYIYRDGVVVQYETDRKEQTHREFGVQGAADFMADEKNPPEIREWVRSCLASAGS